MYEPIPGDVMLNSLKDKGAIILAANARTTAGVAEGIFRAAKDLDSAVIFEIARSECNLDRGYTGLLPSDYAAHINKAAAKVEFDVWALHADHITVKKGTPEMRKKLVKAVIVRMKKGARRSDGTRVEFEDNACVIVDNDGNPKGSDIKGVISKGAVERWPAIGKVARVVL